MIEMFGIMIAHMVFHPPERDFSEKTVVSHAVPLIRSHAQQEVDMLVSQLGEFVEDFTRILSAIVPLDRPERIVVTGNIGLVFLDDAVSALEPDLFPVTQMRKDFDDSPPTVTAGAIEIVVIMRGKQQPAQIVGKTGEVFQDLLSRTSGWFHSLPEVSNRPPTIASPAPRERGPQPGESRRSSIHEHF
ncbi:MAG: hypothetical protein QM747_00495 [Nocardioides sp.]